MKRIAIVEDNDDNMDLIVLLLQKFYELDQYYDGASAIDSIRERNPDLLLLDLSLPGMDGIEVLHEIRKHLPEIKAIVLTAHAMKGDREKFLAAGFDDYFAKPIMDAAEFRAFVKSWI